MKIQKTYAHLSCSDLEASSAWFEKLFGRPHDGQPMPTLHEWYHSDQSGFQLFLDKSNAGHACMTLMVEDLKSDHAELTKIGLCSSQIESGGGTTVLQLRDPDGNLVVLVQG